MSGTSSKLVACDIPFWHTFTLLWVSMMDIQQVARRSGAKGGDFAALGFWQVVCTHATKSAVARAAAEGRPLWRVSSTVFAHIASDLMLEPLGRFAEGADLFKYKPILAGDFVRQELEAIKLKGTAPC